MIYRFHANLNVSVGKLRVQTLDFSYEQGNMPMKEFILYTPAIERRCRLGQATDRRGYWKRTEKPASLGLGAVEGELTGGALNAQRASPRLVRVLVETHGVRDVVREAVEGLRAWKGKE